MNNIQSTLSCERQSITSECLSRGLGLPSTLHVRVVKTLFLTASLLIIIYDID